MTFLLTPGPGYKIAPGFGRLSQKSETAPATICRPYRKVALELWP